MPQLDSSTYIGQLFWLFTTFALLWGAMTYLIVPKLDKIFKKRELKIKNLLEQAEHLQTEAQNLILLDQKKLQDARTEAQEKIQHILNEIQGRKEKHKQEMDIYFQKQLDIAEANLQTLKEKAFQEAALLKEELVQAMIQKMLEKGLVSHQFSPSKGEGDD